MHRKRRAAESDTAPASRILIIDDEPEMLMNYRRLLGRVGYECLTTPDPRQAPALLQQHAPDLVLTDLMMETGSGMDVLRQVAQFDRTLPVIMVTAHGSINNAVQAMKNNATDYVTKPFAPEELLGKIQEALSRRLLERSGAASAAPEKKEKAWDHRIVGVSPQIQAALELARKVARTDVNVLVVGESGTGKELFARLVHHLSPRAGEIFVPVDCASLPESLLESELFGYSKGAFTGAAADKMGLFQFAHRGTLFLDEIGELPLALQSKFLRVLQERRVRPIGGVQELEVNVRVIAATNVDLEQALRARAFRSDLYYRLNVVTLRIPPLRERREDIPVLANHFLNCFCRRGDLPRQFTPEALACLREYAWPGNVRQLQNVVERSVTLALGERIGVADLPDELRGDLAETAEAPRQLFSEKDRLVESFERDYLVGLLVEHQCNVSRAAQAAGCHRRTLYRMIHRHQIDLEAIRRQKTPPPAAAPKPPRNKPLPRPSAE